jgi:hypothetical protein
MFEWTMFCYGGKQKWQLGPHGLPHISVSVARRGFLFRFFFFFGGVGLSPLGTAATSGLCYKPQMIDEGDCGAIGGTKWKSKYSEKPAPAPLCPPQIPHDQTRARTRAAAVGSQRPATPATNRLSYGAARRGWVIKYFLGMTEMTSGGMTCVPSFMHMVISGISVQNLGKRYERTGT